MCVLVGPKSPGSFQLSHCLHTAGVAGSNPASPTIELNEQGTCLVRFLFCISVYYVIGCNAISRLEICGMHIYAVIFVAHLWPTPGPTIAQDI